MRRYTLLIPVADNQGNEYVLDRIERNLANLFGGYSLLQGITVKGGWIDGDRLYRDVSRIVFIIGSNDEAMRDKVALLAHNLGQLSIYLELPDGTIEFIDAA